ncbi:MAG: hypothetical protein QOJ15_8331 [Bradyrhizobium sp.]|jgi:hypothetical protein|nr:hypothetical protein [Bradyrhizobium sp.]
MTLNRAQLIKLLNLTGSEYDAEALNAIRRSNALLRKHRTTWADLLALPQEPAQARQPRPRPRPRGSDAFRDKPMWESKVRHSQWKGYRATNATKQTQFSRIGSLSPSLGVLFFPVAVYVWLYEEVVLTRRGRLRQFAMFVPIFGGGTASLIWILMLLTVAHVMGIA